METHQKELTFSGSRLELRPYIVSDPAPYRLVDRAAMLGCRGRVSRASAIPGIHDSDCTGVG